ncbi:4Fe-4S dicluster domain-containing protein [Thermococcus indicus]|uniref:4Fe-4S dicluster domain-containing protein n=2 Tax=Thermococcus TaxID=2263 RepID=A0A5C0SKL6_9EURY|nr:MULTISPECIES: 4Fe-4S dicluster domain-containing protein [Thermococcus]QDA31244.1 4Fe-4S dicluster domain-containing protein [Thermococcus indicus]QEK14296.1 4Fe-4S dicluster domain-containing protein [Thermococcus aciditolerans]
MPVTKAYPFEPEEAPPEYRGIPWIDPVLCIGCGACANACPPNAILRIDDPENGTRRIVLDVGRCIRCARCEEVCPTGAVRLTAEFEAATDDRNDHVEIVELRLARCRGCGKYTCYTERQVEKVLSLIPRGILDFDRVREKLPLCSECKLKLTVLNATKFGEVEP